MPPIIPPRKEQAAQALAQGARGVRAAASQQQINIANASGLVVFATGILFQQGTSTNYTSGYGAEIPSNGSGSVPIKRAGELTWVSPTLGTQTIVGEAWFDSSGRVNRVIGSVEPAGTRGDQSYDSTGTLRGYGGYFNSSGVWQGNYNA